MIMRYFFKLRLQTRAICVKAFFSPLLSREKTWTENYWKTLTVIGAEASDLLYATGVKVL